MARAKKVIDKVRASRDGHEFHEAWAARRVLELLLSKDDLNAIAVEGVSPSDTRMATSDTLEIADLTLYYGSTTQFSSANRVEIIQFKYSIAKEKDDYRPVDAKKTLQKFSKSFKNLVKQHGLDMVGKKLSFEIITNRPISSDFIRAVELLASKERIYKNQGVQSFVMQIKKATNLNDSQLKLFASKLQLRGLAGSVDRNNKQLSRTIASWSINSGDARARLGDLRDLVRKKAGSAGDNNNNLIKKEHLIEILGLSDETDLFPSPESFPVIEHLVLREQLNDALKLIDEVEKPIIIHASGGVGKTVFLQSLASKLSEGNEVILFDCFGGGAYRAINDNRHRTKRGMLHIVNKLACTGLCDLILPGSGDADDILSIARKRLLQA